jgi:hypothetical protein
MCANAGGFFVPATFRFSIASDGELVSRKSHHCARGALGRKTAQPPASSRGVVADNEVGMSSRFTVLAVTLLALVASCFPTDVCGCTPPLGVGTLAGIVQRTEGRPVPGALVRVEASLRGCQWTESDLVDPNVTTAGPAGHYRYELRAYTPSDTACLRLTAIDTAGASRDSVSVAGIRMRLIPSWGTKQRPDSLRVDLLLP